MIRHFVWVVWDMEILFLIIREFGAEI